MQLLGGDPLDDAFDLRALVRVVGVEAAPVFLEVVIGEQPRPHRVRQLDDLDPVGGHILRALVEPDAVRLLERLCAPTDVRRGVENLELAVAQEIGGGQAGHTRTEHGDIEPLH